MMNILDRVIGTFSPRTALDRAKARTALAALESLRAYDGGRISRRMPGVGFSTSANSELGGVTVTRLRDRARDMVRNNPYCARALDIWTSNVVGSGIVPASRTGSKSKDRKVMDLWRAFSDNCDADAQLDFYGLQSLAVRSAFEGGDALGRLRVRRESDGLKVPLQIQLMEGDFLDSNKNGTVDGFKTVLGIQLSAVGQRLGYWLFPEHPGEAGQFKLGGLTSSKVPVGDILHLYRKARIGQMRGVSAFAPVMLQARDLADLQEAVVVKARIEACFAGFITTEETDGMAIGAASTDAAGNNVQELQPGMLRRLKPGESIDFANPTSSVSFDPVMLHTLMGIAVGLGITYDQLTGDLRQANYSSLRAGKIEMRRLISQVQYQMIIPMFCRPVWRRFIEMCIMMGYLRGGVDDYPCEWIAPAHEAIDPMKDLQADVLAVRSGRMTWDQFVAEWGNDPQTHMQAIADINARMDEHGIVLVTDPRKLSDAGQIQTDPKAQAKQAAETEAAADAAQEEKDNARQTEVMAVLRAIAEKPEPPAPVINVDARTEVTQPDIKVEAPKVDIQNIIPRRGKVKKTVQFDANNRPSGMIEEEVDDEQG